MEKNEEGKIPGAIESISIEKTKIILKQMESSICKIYGKNLGTGFFCSMELNFQTIPVLMTNYHILDDEFLKKKKEIKILMNNDSIIKMININNTKFIYSSKQDKYDLVIIELKNKDLTRNIQLLNLDDTLFNENWEKIYNDKSIYTLHYHNGEKASVSFSYGIKRKKDDIIHKCNTSNGSSGSPILNLSTNKVIGIHKVACKKDESFYNSGSILNNPLIECQSINMNSTPKNIYKKKVCTKKNEALLFLNKLDNNDKKDINKISIKKIKNMNNFSYERGVINENNNFRNNLNNFPINLIYNAYGNMNFFSRKQERNNKSSSNLRDNYIQFIPIMEQKKNNNYKTSNDNRFLMNKYNNYTEKKNREKIKQKMFCNSRDKY
jgi:hypothetical protein